MDLRRLPLHRAHPSPVLAGIAGIALALLAAPPARAEPLAGIGATFDQAGQALNRQIGEWVGAPQKPRAQARRRAAPAAAGPRAPLPPDKPAEAAEAPKPPANPENVTTGDLPPTAPAGPAPDTKVAAQEPTREPETVDVPLPPARPDERSANAATSAEASRPAPAQEPAREDAARHGGKPDDGKPDDGTPAGEERVAAIPTPPPAPAPSAAPAPQAVPTICPELSNGEIGTFEPSVVTATDPLCTVDRGVSLTAIRMKDGRRVELSPPAVLRCEMAASFAHWVRDKAEPAVATLGSPIEKIGIAGSQQCRPRNHVANAKISEHGRGNAVDIGAIVLKDGRTLVIGPPAAGQTPMPAALQETLKASACEDFTTILGPGSDGYHEQHLHLDRAVRRSGAVLCQWNIAGESSGGPKTRVKVR